MHSKLLETLILETFEKADLKLDAPEDILSIDEIQSGTYNHVHKVETNLGVFIFKQATSNLKSKTFKSLKLDPSQRMNVEYEASKIFGEILGEDTIPKIYFFDRENRAILMKYFNGNLWMEELLSSRFNPEIIRDVGAIMGKIHFNTKRKYTGRTLFLNEEVLESELRTHYFDMARSSDSETKRNIIRLAEMHNEDKDVLVHGDLTSRSVLVDRSFLHLIDFELAHLGTPEYDVGHFLSEGFLFMQYCPNLKQEIFKGILGFVNSYFTEFPRTDREKSEIKMVKHSAIIARYRVDGLGKTPFVNDAPSQIRIRKATKEMINNDMQFKDSFELFKE